MSASSTVAAGCSVSAGSTGGREAQAASDMTTAAVIARRPPRTPGIGAILDFCENVGDTHQLEDQQDYEHHADHRQHVAAGR